MRIQHSLSLSIHGVQDYALLLIATALLYNMYKVSC